jgi:hypothetical protein
MLNLGLVEYRKTSKNQREGLNHPPNRMATTLDSEQLTASLNELKHILYPWLGDVSCYGLGRHPNLVLCAITNIRGRGFTRLALRNKDANPDWILAKCRTYTDTDCPRCHHRIMAMLKPHKLNRYTYAAAPSIFCDCIRVQPSKLPSLSFFTGNWQIALEALDFAVAFAESYSTTRPEYVIH